MIRQPGPLRKIRLRQWLSSSHPEHPFFMIQKDGNMDLTSPTERGGSSISRLEDILNAANEAQQILIKTRRVNDMGHPSCEINIRCRWKK
jgi:hypothetical protein